MSTVKKALEKIKRKNRQFVAKRKAEIDRQHEIEKLKKIEKEMLEYIAETGDPYLINKITEWMAQRNVCNQGFTKFISDTIEALTVTKDK